MLGRLRELNIPLEIRRSSLCWVVQAYIMHIATTVDGLGPKSMISYGPVDEETRATVAEIRDELGDRLREPLLLLRGEPGEVLVEPRKPLVGRQLLRGL